MVNDQMTQQELNELDKLLSKLQTTHGVIYMGVVDKAISTVLDHISE